MVAALFGCDRPDKPAPPKPATRPATKPATPSTKPAKPTVRFAGKTWQVLKEFYFDAPGKVYVEKDTLVLEPGTWDCAMPSSSVSLWIIAVRVPAEACSPKVLAKTR